MPFPKLKMSTKFILHGGNAQHVNTENDNFFTEILKDTKDKVKILLVEFAGRDEKVNPNFETDKSHFMRIKEYKDISFELATENDFLDQIKNSDVVYIGGGTTVRLMNKIKKYTDLGKAFEGKVVAGESAGANCLSVYCYSKSAGGVFGGLGLVPVKTIPHYIEGLETNFKDLPSEIGSLFLPEYKFRVFEMDQ